MADLFGTMTPLEACQVVRAVQPGTPFDVTHAAAFDTILREAEQCSRIADVAAIMRAAQKRYFRDRSNLDECKAAERELDRLLKVRADA